MNIKINCLKGIVTEPECLECALKDNYCKYPVFWLKYFWNTKERKYVLDVDEKRIFSVTNLLYCIRKAWISYRTEELIVDLSAVGNVVRGLAIHQLHSEYEEQLTVPIDEDYLVGIPDAILNINGKRVLIECKTKNFRTLRIKYFDEELLQCQIYCWMLAKNNKPVDEIRLTRIYDYVETLVFKPDNVDYYDFVKNKINQIKSNKVPELLESNLCYSCWFKHKCKELKQEN